MEAIFRAREKSEPQGFIKILVDADTEELIGVLIPGDGGDAIINVFVPYMYTKQSYKDFRKAVFTHPTVGRAHPVDPRRPPALVVMPSSVVAPWVASSPSQHRT